MWVAAWIVTAVFILSNAATPLYVRWQAAIGFSSATLTVIFAVYILGLLLALLVAGKLSDRFGRRPVLLAGLAVAIMVCLPGAGRRGHGARREAGAGTALATEPGADRGSEANAGGDREAVGGGVGEAQDVCGVCLIGYRAGPDGVAITPDA